MIFGIYSAHEVGVTPQAIQQFYNLHWPRKIALSVDDFYRWQFMNSPTSNELDHCCVAIDNRNQELVGIMGLTPRPFHLNGNLYSGAELTTWIINPDYQSKGIGAYILEYLQAKYEILIGMGISVMAIPLYCRTGFRYLSGIPRYIKVFNWDAVSKYSEVAPLAKKIDRYWNSKITHEKYTVYPVTKVEVDNLNNKNQQQFNYFSRDMQHVNWRYINHPVFTYKSFLVSGMSASKENSALVCFREETAVSGVRLLHVLDCIGDDAGISAAINFIEDYARDNNFDAIDFYCTASSITKFFIARGWFSAIDDTSLKMPHLFHPIELRTPATTSLVYWAKTDLINMCDFSKLYITKQDADFDRPTQATLELTESSRQVVSV